MDNQYPHASTSPASDEPAEIGLPASRETWEWLGNPATALRAWKEQTERPAPVGTCADPARHSDEISNPRRVRGIPA
jgi:hypothetical protein